MSLQIICFLCIVSPDLELLQIFVNLVQVMENAMMASWNVIRVTKGMGTCVQKMEILMNQLENLCVPRI